MPKGYPPSVFVSSTCYDLNQVRADMKRFLENMGLDPILSETPAFPVSPQAGPVENCLRAVKERADIFVLIVGARYGSQNESGKSITNLEYLEAKAKGIPVYVFVLKQMLNVLPVWKKNPQANYEGTVDTPKLFEFIEALRSSQNHWVFEFEEVQHIMDTLRRQLGYLFMEALLIRGKFNNFQLSPALIDLPAKSLKIIFEKPFGWEYRLFSSVLDDEMQKYRQLKWDLAYGLKLGKIYKLDDLPQVFDWIQQKIAGILALAHSIERLLNKAIQEAFGAPGVSGNPEQIVYAARRVAQVCKELLAWSIEFNCTEVNPECERLLALISAYSGDLVEQLESLPSRLDAEIDKGLVAQQRGEKHTGEIFLTFKIPENEELVGEIRRLGQILRQDE